jgi:hypothetical protein
VERLGARLSACMTGRYFGIGLLVIAALYVLFVGMMLALAGIFTYVGIDYLALLCSLRFTHANGFEHIYDLMAQARFHDLANASQPSYAHCDTPPGPYLPVFMALFEPLVLLSALPGYVLWSLLNLALFAWYCYRFTRAVGGDYHPTKLLKVVLAYALYENMVAGQVNVPMFVCFGEAILAYLRRQPLASGAWLAGMMLKPQVLLLVVPGLVFGRYVKPLVGYAIACLVIGVLSLGLAGVEGMQDLQRLLQYYSAGAGPAFPEAGMNWRALAINLTPLVGETAAWGVAWPGLVLTVLAGIAVWLAPRRGNADDQFVLALLGSFAASSTVIWHSHVYSGLPVLAPLLYLRVRGRLPEWLFNAWLILPAAAFFIAAFGVTPKAGHPSAGLTMLFVNILLVGWAMRALWQRRGQTNPPSSPLI